MDLQTNHPRRRWPLVLLAALIALLIAGVVAYQFAVRTAKEKIIATLGPRGEVKELKVGLTGVEITGLRIRAPEAAEQDIVWPVEDELRAERIMILPSYTNLIHSRIVLESIRVEGGYVSILRTKGGKVRVLPSLLERKSADSAPDKAATPAANAPETPSPSAAASPGTPVTIENIELINGTIEFFDATIRKPPVKQRLEQISAQITKISLPDLTGQSTIRLQAVHKGIRQDGNVSIDGTIELATRESGITSVLHNVDLLSLQPYLIKAGESGVSKGSLDFELNSSIKKGMLYAPGSLSLSDLELSPTGSFMGIPRKLATTMMKNRKGKIAVNFVLTGDINDPDFSLNENLSTRIASSIAGKLGVDIEGLAKGVGGIGGSTATAIGKSLGILKKK